MKKRNILISIVIPVLNEEKYLRQTVNAVFDRAQNNGSIEIIVIDTGSEDKTLEIAKELKLKVFEKPEFSGHKYQALNFGFHRANGDILLFLDADTILPKRYDQLVLDLMQKQEVVGGAFEFAFDKKNLSLLFVQLVNRARYRIRKRYYSDQAIFCRKVVLEQIGGFPEKQLMESAYLCAELIKTGKLKLIKSPVITSSRRFTKNGVMKTFFKDFTIWIQFILGMDVSGYAKKYWAFNRSEERL